MKQLLVKSHIVVFESVWTVVSPSSWATAQIIFTFLSCIRPVSPSESDIRYGFGAVDVSIGNCPHRHATRRRRRLHRRCDVWRRNESQ